MEWRPILLYPPKQPPPQPTATTRPVMPQDPTSSPLRPNLPPKQGMPHQHRLSRPPHLVAPFPLKRPTHLTRAYRRRRLRSREVLALVRHQARWRLVLAVPRWYKRHQALLRPRLFLDSSSNSIAVHIYICNGLCAYDYPLDVTRNVYHLYHKSRQISTPDNASLPCVWCCEMLGSWSVYVPLSTAGQ
jgi:hypothetical protein